jgi:hypothetical protein
MGVVTRARLIGVRKVTITRIYYRPRQYNDWESIMMQFILLDGRGGPPCTANPIVVINLLIGNLDFPHDRMRGLCYNSLRLITHIY